MLRIRDICILDGEQVPEKCAVYSFYFPDSGKSYIGSALNLRKRVAGHYSSLRRGVSHCILLQRAWNKYGRFWLNVLEECSPTTLREREAHWIKLFNSTDRSFGYNISNDTAAPMTGLTHNSTTKELMSLKAKGNKANSGRVFTIEHRLRMSKSMKGKNKGRVMTEAQVQANKERNSGNKNPFYGKKHSTETIEKIRAAKLKKS